LTELAAGASHSHTLYISVPFTTQRAQLDLCVAYRTVAGFRATVSHRLSLPVREALQASVAYYHTDLSPLPTSSPLPLHTLLLARVCVEPLADVALRVQQLTLDINPNAGRLLESAGYRCCCCCCCLLFGFCVESIGGRLPKESENGALLAPGGQYSAWFRLQV
jgi:hypothetical protein